MGLEYSNDRRLQIRIRQSLLQDWDPIGIKQFSEAQDEYDSYVLDICEILRRDNSISAILNYLWWLETVHMGLSGQYQTTAAFSKKLFEIGKELLAEENS